MPENNATQPGFENAAENNAEVAAKLAAQDISGHSMAPKDTLDASTALDDLAKQHDEAAKKAAEAPIVEKKDENAPPAKTEAEIAAEKAAADAAEAERKRAEELFKDSPGLPAGASPKSSESFAAIKVKAAREIAKAEAELAQLRKENAEAQEKLKNAVPPETLKELEDHRKWRARLDVEADPKFKEFDKNIAQTQEFIYAQLKRSPAITAEVIDAIKKHGGPENVQMAKIFDAVKDPAMQRLIESKLADIEMAKFSKSEAIKSAKENIAQYVSEREKSAVDAQTGHNAATEKHFAELAQKLDWMKPVNVDSKAPEAERKAAEAHNAFVADLTKNLEVAKKDDSPEMRAIMLAGMAQLFRMQNIHPQVVAERDALKKSLEELTAKYDKLRHGSVSRLRESGAAPGTRSDVVTKPSDQFTKTAAESLDDLRKQVTEERERAQAAGGK